MNKYPFKYYLILFLALLLSILFWFLVLLRYQWERGGRPYFTPPIGSVSQPPALPSNYYRVKPIDRDKIIIDTISRRKIVSDLLNLAIKDTVYQAKRFVQEFTQKFDTTQYRINYVDSTINYMQLKVADADRAAFKQKVKTEMPAYDLLVWDEALFDKQATDSNRYLQAENLYPLRQLSTSHIKVAVIDNGFDLQHPSLAGRYLKPYNATDNSTDVSPLPINHGTAVASIIVGNKYADIQGIVPSAQLIPIKVADANGMMSSTYIIKAVLYAIKNQADVVNISLGANLQGLDYLPEPYQQEFIKNGAKDEETFWKELFAYSEKNKTIIVLAAGNDNMLTGFDPLQRAENTIKVGAVDEHNRKSKFSNYGTLTTVYAQGENIKVASTGNQTEIIQGTSFAAPIVTAFVVALKSKYPQFSSSQIIAELKKNTIYQQQLAVLYNKTF